MLTEVSFLETQILSIPQSKLISNNYLKSRMNNFSFDRATSSSEISYGEFFPMKVMKLLIIQ